MFNRYCPPSHSGRDIVAALSRIRSLFSYLLFSLIFKNLIEEKLLKRFYCSGKSFLE